MGLKYYQREDTRHHPDFVDVSDHKNQHDHPAQQLQLATYVPPIRLEDLNKFLHPQNPGVLKKFKKRLKEKS